MNIIGEKVRIRDKIPADSIHDIVWGLDEEILALDPSAGETLNIHLFSIETLDSRLIGFCSLYNQTQEEVQLGIRIGNKDYWSKGYGTEAVSMLMNYAFSADIRRVWLKVLPSNARAIRCYEKCGFVNCGRLLLDGYNFTLMERRRDG